MSLDPATARPRGDLPFLVTRSRPKPAPVVAVTPSPAPPVTQPKPVVRAPAVSSSLDLDAPITPAAPQVSSSLDLSPAPAAPRAPATSTSLDLSPAPAAPRAPAASTSLDLDSTPARRAVPPPAPPRRRPVKRQAPSGAQTLLSGSAPTVTLSRVQSGVGTLTVTAACGPGVGDLRLGCAYQLADGRSSTVQHEGGNRNGLSDSGSPVVQAQRHEFQTVAVDLRRIKEITRLMFFAFSASHVPLAWGGTLIATTLGQASVEAAIDPPLSSPVAVLLSAYQVGGELILRRAMVSIPTTVKAACLAYGFERITWLDDWTPTS